MKTYTARKDFSLADPRFFNAYTGEFMPGTVHRFQGAWFFYPELIKASWTGNTFEKEAGRIEPQLFRVLDGDDGLTDGAPAWLHGRRDKFLSEDCGLFTEAAMAELERRREAEAVEKMVVTMVRREEEAMIRDIRSREILRFNESLIPGAKYHGASKIVLSGLYDTWGAGVNRRSVSHLVFDGAFRDGRLKREEGDLLCSAGDRGSYDLTESGGPMNHHRIDCKKCLEMAERIRNRANSKQQGRK